jgi:hypothetical protein
MFTPLLFAYILTIRRFAGNSTTSEDFLSQDAFDRFCHLTQYTNFDSISIRHTNDINRL